MRAPATALWLVLGVLTACGASARDKALHATYASLAAGADGFVAFDPEAQKVIVSTAASEADGIAKLASYRAKRAHVVEAFGAAFHALAGAALLEQKGDLSHVLEAAQQAIEAWQALKGAP